MMRTAVRSRSVRSAGYDADECRMEIEFAAGGIYEYFDVPKAVYEWLMRVPNKGRYVTRIIANKYRFRVRPAEAATEHGSSLAEQLQRSVAALSERSPSSSGTSSSVT